MGDVEDGVVWVGYWLGDVLVVVCFCVFFVCGGWGCEFGAERGCEGRRGLDLT